MASLIGFSSSGDSSELTLVDGHLSGRFASPAQIPLHDGFDESESRRISPSYVSSAFKRAQVLFSKGHKLPVVVPYGYCVEKFAHDLLIPAPPKSTKLSQLRLSQYLPHLEYESIFTHRRVVIVSVFSPNHPANHIEIVYVKRLSLELVALPRLPQDSLVPGFYVDSLSAVMSATWLHDVFLYSSPSVPDMQDMFLIEDAARPGSDIYKRCEILLLSEEGEENSLRQHNDRKGKDFTISLPFKGNPVQMEEFKRKYSGFSFPSSALYINGVGSACVLFYSLLDMISLASKSKRITQSVCFSQFNDELSYVVGNVQDTNFEFYTGESIYNVFETRPFETAIMDHTTVCLPLDRWLNVCHNRGVRIVEGVFYYHPAMERGWDCEFSWTKLSVLHSDGKLNIGPIDDATRRLTYTVAQYRTFIDPSSWMGSAREYIYEIYNHTDNLMSYRAVYVGSIPRETLSFNLPMCSDPDNIIITINKDFLNSAFIPTGQYFQQMTMAGSRNHAIEVSRDTFEATVSYLVTLSPNADITGQAIKYVAARNYIDLVDGAKLVRKPALSYTNALCLALVCALVSFQLRFELTNESAPIIAKALTVARGTSNSMGLFGALILCVKQMIQNKTESIIDKSIKHVKGKLGASDHIPGVIYDVYLAKEYNMGSVYHAYDEIIPEIPFLEDIGALPESDPFITFVGGDVNTGPELRVQEVVGPVETLKEKLGEHEVPPLKDPIEALQTSFDELLPGHSILDIPNVSEQRRVNDININAEFVGRVSVNRDVVVSENLYKPTPLRTSAIPQTKTSLTDLITASSKRNWNRPDLQLVTDVYSMAELFVDEFIQNAMIPNAANILASKEANPTTFNALDYCEWLSTRSEVFRESLLASCPNEILELNLEKYQTILKGRVKQKMSTTAEYELPQGQVVIHHDPSTNALFTSVFRRAFNTFDVLLRKEYKSAGRISDTELSQWLTDIKSLFMGSKLVELDSSKYDKSQGLLAQAIEAVMLRRLGIDPKIIDIYAESYVGSVNSRNLGLAFIIAFQRKSGAADTMFGNLVYNFVSAGRSIGYDRIKFALAKGDDNLIGVTEASATLVSQKMAYVFNLDAKVLLEQVPSFSSGYVVPLEDALVFVPDPLKKTMLLGEINARTGNSSFKVSDSERRDRFISFADSVSVYGVSGVPAVLESIVRHRMRRPAAGVQLMIDALLVLSRDYNLFSKAVSF